MSDNPVYVVDAVRTPIGRMGGAFRELPAEELAAAAVRHILAHNPEAAGAIGEVVLGQTKQSSDAPNIARVVALASGLSHEIPAYTVHRQCASGMQAVQDGTRLIRSGECEVVLVGGVESMSTAPYYLRNARFGYTAGNGELLDPNTESQPRSQPEELYGRLTMGMTAEILAEKYRIARDEQDHFALESQRRAHTAIEAGWFASELLPVTVPQRKGESVVVSRDEHPRYTTLEQLAALPPIFKPEGSVTAGNASGRNDGASAILLASARAVDRLGLRPLARIVSWAVAGVRPDEMGMGPVPASKLALERGGLTLDDMDLVEINEAFAAQVLAVLRELPVRRERLNIHGGAIALGHPIGNSGARIVVTLVHALRRLGVRFGLATLCAAGGMGSALIIERA